MAATATDELVLLERVFLRLGSAEMDDQLQAAVGKFLPPVLLKLSSTQEGVRKKVMELLIHINKRLKSRPKVQLPVEALLLQYQDPAASSFVTNFTIIYIKMGYPRMDIAKQAELIPSVLNAVEGKPQSHQDSLMFIIMPALGHIKIPADPDKRDSLLGLKDKPNVAKLLSTVMLNNLLINYGSIATVAEQYDRPIDWNQIPTPPGFSQYEFKRTMCEHPRSAEEQEKTKLGIVKFLSGGFYSESDILIHLIIAASDTKFSVANLANAELKKIVSSVDWSSAQVAAPLYCLFLGTIQKDVKPEMKKLPIDLYHRLKIMQYLLKVSNAGFIIPACIQVVFESLYGKMTTLKLQSLALKFTLNIVQQCSLTRLSRFAGVILNGMMKLIEEGDQSLRPMAYTIIGHLGQRIPTLVNNDLTILQKFFETLTSSEGDLRSTVKDALICMTTSFVLKAENQNEMTMMNALLSCHIEAGEQTARYVAVHYVATVFPSNDVSSRYLLLLACIDSKQEVKNEALKALYGTCYKNERDKSDMKEIAFPDFTDMVLYLHKKVQAKMNSVKASKTDNKSIPFEISVFTEMITYLRLCLSKSAGISMNEATALQHPCKFTPIIGRYLDNLYKINSECLNDYLDLVVQLAHATSGSDQVSLDALLEVMGTIPQHMVERHTKELPWIKSFLSSTKEKVRELCAKIYAMTVAWGAEDDLEQKINEILSLTKSGKSLETQHGALLALSHTMERKLAIMKKQGVEMTGWKIYSNVVKTICSFINDKNAMLISAAIQSLGLIGKTYSLPLINDSEVPDQTTKKSVMTKLFSLLGDSKLNSKIKERAAMTLGFLCIGENFPFTKEIAENFINKADETKDVDVHLTIGEALVYCVQGISSPEARDSWTTLANEHQIPYSQQSNELLKFVLDNLLELCKKPHPNSRQAVCIWLLALLKHNSNREYVVTKMPAIQNAFMDFLSESSDIVQDVASKGLHLVYESSSEEERKNLVESITAQLLHGKRSVNKVTADTKLFDDELGKSPTGGGISTYREICSLASDLNKPELIYKFLHLANHNAIWTSKKGAAFGFSAIASLASEELNKHLPVIVPKLYRYQFDPTPKTQQSMASIWHAIVPSTTKAVEQYHKEILDDLTANLTNNQWRVRYSCCSALNDLLKSNAPYDLAVYGPELWKQLFRVMDDIHEGTRTAANQTARILGKICVRHCDSTNGKAGEKVLQAILPVFLDIGIKHTVTRVRLLSLQTVSQLLSSAGNLLKPSLVTLIPALLMATGELENLNTAAFHSLLGATSVEHFATDTISKCIQYFEVETLKDLMPKILELWKSTVNAGTKLACGRFLILLCGHMKLELQPYAGKLMTVLSMGLNDRNPAIRKSNATVLGHLIGCAKDSSIEKLLTNLDEWYMSREDDTQRLSIGQCLHSMNNHNQEKLKNFSNMVIPLVFFAMHVEKVPENEEYVKFWEELWSEIAPGTELGIRQNLEEIIQKSSKALESASWTTKAQAANAIATVAQRLGSDVDEEKRKSLLRILTSGLQGRTWKGKERLLLAISTLACNSKEMLKNDPALTELIVEALYKESKKEATEYRRFAIKAFSDVLHELNVDRFTQVYEIAQNIFSKLSNKDSDDEGTSSQETTKKREDKIKLQEAVYEALGKAWPKCKPTQDKYCLEFITYCHDTLPNSIRTIQVTILTTLNLYIEKLLLLEIKPEEMSESDKKTLRSILDPLEKVLRLSIGISKYTRIRKEALNMIITLLRKMQNVQNEELFSRVKSVFQDHLPELHKDNQPEIRSRVVDIKAMLKI